MISKWMYKLTQLLTMNSLLSIANRECVWLLLLFLQRVCKTVQWNIYMRNCSWIDAEFYNININGLIKINFNRSIQWYGVSYQFYRNLPILVELKIYNRISVRLIQSYKNFIHFNNRFSSNNKVSHPVRVPPRRKNL